MKCLKCATELELIEKVNGEYEHSLSESGEFLPNYSIFYGESDFAISCPDCKESLPYHFEGNGRFVLDKKDNKKIFILIGPSGSGKDTLGSHLEDMEIPELVSHTTREIRKGEVNGVDYNFITKEEFDKIEKLEYSEYAGNYYCLSRGEVERKLNDTDMVFAITDIHGAMQIKEIYPEETVLIFISVTQEEMIERMKKRGDSEENIKKRIQNSIDSKELENGKNCDYVIRNKNLASALKQLDSIINIEVGIY